ncbi:MAG TPA: site-specific DNA-methyltransferase, partial [Candidatus Avacidaminococcus intestinavium]|nr:site-specific DNA-methyltransferase [Candidatus Avacidaminococcus intestinavium]
MNKLKMHSPNKVDENIEKIGKLFPNCLTECKNESGEVEYAIDFDMLRQELSSVVVEGREERYQFTWPDKKNAILLANSPIAKTLRPIRSESMDFDNTENLYIEGDNLDVLKLLQETYLGKVKMIYIDPPYNTGKDSFVYNDDFGMNQCDFAEASGQYDDEGNILFDLRVNNESNGKFHSDWLNMIYPRLKLAKDLLCNDGVILINMDENEITNLQKICQEVFGEQNDLGTIIWDKRNPKGDAQGISYQHEYILVFAKSKYEFLSTNKIQRPKKNASAIIKKANQLYSRLSAAYTLDEINKEFSSWMRDQKDFSGGEKAYNKIDENGDVFRPVSMAWPNKKKAPDDYFIPLVHPITNKPCPVPERGWRNPSSTMQKMLAEGKIIFGNDETTIPNSKYLLKENMYENISSLIYYGGSDTAFLDEIGVPFDTPKVADICKEHILSFTSNDDIVLDFFSGSATVAHGVMLANTEDGGKRKFIMVQLAEKCDEQSPLGMKGFSTICEAGKERIRQSAKGIDAQADTGFRVLKCDSTNMKDVYYNPADYHPDLFTSLTNNIKEDRTPEDLLFQVMLDLGVLLSSKIEESTIAGKKVFNVADGFLIACFDENVTEETIKEIAQNKPYYFVMRDSSMASDSVATNFEQIFATYSPDTVRKV